MVADKACSNELKNTQDLLQLFSVARLISGGGGRF